MVSFQALHRYMYTAVIIHQIVGRPLGPRRRNNSKRASTKLHGAKAAFVRNVRQLLKPNWIG